jgi:hypothetical protein
MTEDQARGLFRAHCSTGQQGSLEAYGERPAVAALMTAYAQMGAALHTIAGSAPVDRPPDPDYSCGNADDVASQASDLAWWFAAEIARAAMTAKPTTASSVGMSEANEPSPSPSTDGET